jgi:hypothetical protein
MLALLLPNGNIGDPVEGSHGKDVSVTVVEEEMTQRKVSTGFPRKGFSVGKKRGTSAQYSSYSFPKTPHRVSSSRRTRFIVKDREVQEEPRRPRQ